MLSFIERLGKERYRLLAFCLPLSVYLMGLNSVWSSDYPTSILGMQYAMWANHSLSLGTTGSLLVQSADLSSYAGSFYSAISPGFAILSFPFAALGFVLDGGALNLWGWSLVLDEAFVAICSAAAAMVVYETARLYASKRGSLVASLALAFATPLWPASTVLFIHGVSLMFSILSICFILRFTHAKGGAFSLVASGIFLGLAGFVEYVALLYVVPIVLYLAVRRLPGAIPRFLGGYSIGPVSQLAYNYIAFRNPLLFPEQLKAGATGSLLYRFDLYGALIHSAFYLVSPYRGIFLFSPIAGLGIFALLSLAGKRIPRCDAALLLSIFAITLVWYSSWADWNGGLFYGPRFLILGLPSLMIPLAVAVDEWPSKSARLAVLALFGVSSFVEGVGALTTGFGMQGGPFTFELTSLNLPMLIQGKLDAWWISFWSLQASAVVVILPVFVFAALWSVTMYVILGKPGHYRPPWLGTTSPWYRAQRKTKTIAPAAEDSKT